ncbi:MAG: hypothetical protein LC792_14270, partial [Actinobacteria bacterium]|nr:hypothetical protein [Actinomycetota bacterium]
LDGPIGVSPAQRHRAGRDDTSRTPPEQSKSPLAHHLIRSKALVAGNGPMAVLGISDPGSWTARGWLADVMPHAAHGLVTTAVLAALDGDRAVVRFP